MPQDKFCSIIPDDMLRRIKDRKSLELSKIIRQQRIDLLAADAEPIHEETRNLYDAEGTYTKGKLILSERLSYSNEPSSNEHFQMFNLVYDFIFDNHKRQSYDGNNAAVHIFKNVGQDYNNAFWDGLRFAFGNGDQEYFRTFWIQDIVSHEFFHAVTEYVSGLIYVGQSGALNEHMSDVFGVCVNQFLNKQTPSEADWLIGAGVFMASINGKSLRTFKDEIAYDDKFIGRDPQVKHMRDFYNGTGDNGGVHINSGIPNHAFYKFCMKTGLQSWVIPFTIWFNALALTKPTATFKEFAINTIDRCPAEYKQQLDDSWYEVGIDVKEVYLPAHSLWNRIIDFLLRLFSWINR